jgi:hypothetical protein
MESQLKLLKSSAHETSNLVTSHFANFQGEKENNDATPTPGGTPTPTPDGTTPTPGAGGDDLLEKGNVKISNKMVNFNKQSEEEKNYKSKIRQYRTYFEKGKFNELEDLIDSCNKDSSASEYKFNFTFDQYKYGNKQISYIVRCIDNKNDFDKSDEDTVGEFDVKATKYKKEKADSIKPLYEILESEKKELLSLPEIFYKLSLDDKKFQRLLQQCKNDIQSMSMAHGQKKDEIMEDENSSQSSQIGFDSGLVKKNRIEEIRSNLLLNVSNFYTLKYIKLVFVFLALCSFIFCVIYIILFKNLYDTLIDVSSVNVNLFQTTLWTTELVSIFISLRTLFLKNTIKGYEFDFSNYDNDKNGSKYRDNYNYYTDMEIIARDLYTKISKAYGILEMDIPKYLTDEQLNSLYWDKTKVSYMNEIYKNFSHMEDQSTFPMSIAQLLSNSLSYLKSPTFNSIFNNTKFHDDYYRNYFYFDYMTYIIIENGYDNILPNQLKKISEIPNIISNLNNTKRKNLYHIIFIFSGIIIILSILYIILIKLTNKSMTDGIKKVIKIKLEKIDEIIKKIKLFIDNLKKFNENDLISEDYKEYSDYANINSLRNNEQNEFRIRKRHNNHNYESSLVNNIVNYFDIILSNNFIKVKNDNSDEINNYYNSFIIKHFNTPLIRFFIVYNESLSSFNNSSMNNSSEKNWILLSLLENSFSDCINEIYKQNLDKKYYSENALLRKYKNDIKKILKELKYIEFNHIKNPYFDKYMKFLEEQSIYSANEYYAVNTESQI